MCRSIMMSIVRKFVSKRKRRFQENGFDLDLSYITSRIIVMGFPAEGKEGLFRNPLSEVMRFLRTYHDHHFKVINLCAEREYDPSKLGGNVERIPFEDHQPAPLSVILKFCQSADEWLSKNENNVLVTHCKAGKGRSGMMLCCFLLYTKYCPDPLTALQFYAEKRTKNEKGVTIPSQRRYVGYFYDFIEKGPRPSVKLELAQISFTANIVCTKDIYVVVYSTIHAKETYKPKKVLSTLDSKTNSNKSGRTLILGLNPTWINGDIKVEFFCNLEAPIFYFWFNTAYVNGSDFSLWRKEELDKPSKSMESDIQVSLFFMRRLPTDIDERGQLENHAGSTSIYSSPW